MSTMRQAAASQVTFALSIYATRGAGGRDRSAERALSSWPSPTRGRQIVAKEIFTAEIAFDADSASARAVEEIEQWIPLGPGEIGAGYETLVGFQFSPAQLEDTRRSETQ